MPPLLLQLPTLWHHKPARLCARDIFLMVPLPALLTALLSCQLAGLVLAPHRQLGSLHGHAGLGACVQVAEHPWCPAQGAQRSPGHFLGPHSGQRDVGGCDGEIPGSQSWQVRTAVRAVLRHGTVVSQGFSCSRCSISAILDEQRADEQLPLGTSELPDLPDKVPYHLALLFQSSKQLRGKKGPALQRSSTPMSAGLLL